MKRKEFIKTGLKATAGAIAMPYLLPSGRLFAKTGSVLADHVVFVLFGGGVRQQDSILQRYLSDSQNVDIGGNIMYNLFNGAPPDSKIAYGTTPHGQPNGSEPIPKLLGQTLQQQGTIFAEMQAVNGGHYGGLNSLLTGNSSLNQGLKVRPINPTIFEYVRRYGGYKATDVWFIGNGIGNSVPLLNSSNHPEYGLQYGANFFAPGITFGSMGKEVLADAKVYHPQEELEPMYKMRNFLDNTYRIKQGDVPGIQNTEEERIQIKQFVRDVFAKQASNQIDFPPVSGGDASTIGYAIEVLKAFKPKLLVVNLSNVDTAHGNFTGSLQALHRADHALGYLWNQIQTQIPGMSNNTIMLTVPECGRNLNPNPIKDENGWFGYDHGDANTRRVWGSMVGPNVPANLTIGSENNGKGVVTDGILTIADILGIKPDVQSAGFINPGSRSLFDYI